MTTSSDPSAAPPNACRRWSAATAPQVRREIDERVDQRPASALVREIADEAMRVDPIGGAEVDDAQHRRVRKQPRRGQRCRVGHLERGALRERVARVVVRHARELGVI
jgi:hypothetical protein